MIELENWCAYFSKKVFVPSPTNFLPQSFVKTSVFDKAQSNEKDKDKDKDKDKNKDIGTNNMDLVWQVHNRPQHNISCSVVFAATQPAK